MLLSISLPVFSPLFIDNRSVPKQRLNSIHWLCQPFELVFEEVQKMRYRIKIYLLVAMLNTNYLTFALITENSSLHCV